MLYQKDVEKILGLSNEILFVGSHVKHAYHINNHISLWFSVDQDVVYHIRWYTDKGKPIALQDIFENLSEKIQEIIIFNMDIFKYEGCLPIYGTLKNDLKI